MNWGLFTVWQFEHFENPKTNFGKYEKLKFRKDRSVKIVEWNQTFRIKVLF